MLAVVEWVVSTAIQSSSIDIKVQSEAGSLSLSSSAEVFLKELHIEKVQSSEP